MKTTHYWLMPMYRKSLEIGNIIDECCRVNDVNEKTLRWKVRKRKYVNCRFMISFMINKYFPHVSVHQIKLYIGVDNHTSVLNAIKRHQQYYSVDNDYKDKFDKVEEFFK